MCFVSVLWFFAWRWFLLAFFAGLGVGLLLACFVSVLWFFVCRCFVFLFFWLFVVGIVCFFFLFCTFLFSVGFDCEM